MYRPIEGTPDLAEGINQRLIPSVPEVLSRLIRSTRDHNHDIDGADSDRRHTDSRATVSARERAWAQAALLAKKSELAQTQKGGRNNAANAIAYAMGRIIGAGWIAEDEVRQALEEACKENGLSKEDPRGCGATLDWKIS